MNKVLIAVLSCAPDRPLAQAQLDGCFTGEWPRADPYGQVEAGLKYFIGCKPTGPLEIKVECGDSYADLPFKTQYICDYALDNRYDWVFKCDTDTLVHVPRLMAALPKALDYSGYYRGHPSEPSYASGGSGYWLSRRAMKVVALADFEKDFVDPESPERGYIRGEDLQVGRALAATGIFCFWDERYRLDEHLPHPGNDVITTHNVRAPLKGKAMRQAWAKVEQGFRGRL